MRDTQTEHYMKTYIKLAEKEIEQLREDVSNTKNFVSQRVLEGAIQQRQKEIVNTEEELKG